MSAYVTKLHSIDGLIETAKANDIEPYAYLRTVFGALPQATSVGEIVALLSLPDGSADSVGIVNRKALARNLPLMQRIPKTRILTMGVVPKQRPDTKWLATVHDTDYV